jgi:hypothetical protein
MTTMLEMLIETLLKTVFLLGSMIYIMYSMEYKKGKKTK